MFVIKLTKSLAAFGNSDFKKILKAEIQQLDKNLLPLQEGLSQTSYVGDSGIEAVILNVSETKEAISVKTSIFYSGIIAGSCCSDDPTPVDEQPEQCDMLFVINKNNAETTVTLISD